MTNYPPGVSGNEREIAGPDHERELTDEACPRCGAVALLEEGWRGDRWVSCGECGHQEEREPEWCCDAGPVGHGGRHWHEE